MGGASLGVITVSGSSASEAGDSSAPNSEPICYQIRFKDAGEGGEHGDAFFSLSADFDYAQSRGKAVQELVDELMEETFEEHGGASELLEPWGDLNYLPAGIKLPDAPLTNRRELKSFIEAHYGESCCIGWIYS